MGATVTVIEGRFYYRLSKTPTLLSADGDLQHLLGCDGTTLLRGQQSLLHSVHEADAEIIRAIFAEDGEGAGSANVRICHPDGRILCTRADYRKVVSGNELTLQLALREAKSLWRAGHIDFLNPQLLSLMEKTEKYVLFKDVNHVITGSSSAFISLMRHLLGDRELAGLTDYDLHAKVHADRLYALDDIVLNTGEERHDILEVVTGFDEAAWIHVKKFAIKAESGEIVGLGVMARDVAERIQSDEELDETAESLRESLKLARVGSYLFDIHRGVWTSSAFLDSTLGIEPSIRHTFEEWASLVHPDDRAVVLAHLYNDVLRDGKQFNLEYRILRPADGQIRWALGIGKVERGPNGEAQIMRGTIQDITERKIAEGQLRESWQRFQLLVENAPAALAMFDREMRYLAVSRRWVKSFGLETVDLIGHSHYEVFPAVPAHLRDAHLRGLAGESVRNDDDVFETSDGSLIRSRWEILPWRLDDGSVGGIVVFVEDISQAKEIERRLQLSATVFEHASEGIIVTDLDGMIADVNEAFTKITGYGRADVIGKNPRLLNSGLQNPTFYQSMWRALMEQGRWRGELWNCAKDGKLFVVDSTLTTVFGNDGKPQYYVALFFDVTPAKEQERKLEQLSWYDSLTGLPNRALLAERLRYAMTACRQSGETLAVVLFDLDEFKNINDLYGHEAADALLIEVSTRIRQALQDGDTLARVGGDEFIAVLRDASPDGAAPRLARLLEAASQPCMLRDSLVQVSATAGATFYPQEEEVDGDQLMRQADRAMYEAKLAGKNRYYVFDPVRDHSVRGRHEEIEQIRQALAHNEFVLHYQPRVNMATGELVGVEGLLRWQHPKRGLLPPGLFLPTIEDHDIMIEVGEWVLDTALSQAQTWQDEGLSVVVSVNLGARQLEQAGFVERLRTVMAGHPGVAASSLELEVLETSALHDLAGVSSVIKACRELGVSIALDDFGTGYSSLTYLKRLPANVLKIDQSFVRDMLDDPDDLAILQGVIGLATAFRRTAVAEGVETVRQGELLLRLGCRFAQGYGIARPMPGCELLAWIAQWRPDPLWTAARPLNPTDWPILSAEVELRSWNLAFAQFIKGERPSVPELDAADCRFGIWLNSEKYGLRGQMPRFRSVEALHLHAHTLAARAVECKMGGKAEQAAELLAQTLDVRRQIISQMKFLFSPN